MPQPATETFAKTTYKREPKWDFRDVGGMDLTDGKAYILIMGSDYDAETSASSVRTNASKFAKTHGFAFKTQTVDRSEDLISDAALKDLIAAGRREFGVKVQFWPLDTKQPGPDGKPVEDAAAVSAAA